MSSTQNSLLALVAFSFVSSITPGPNNALLWASGAMFGLRRTLPHVLGTALGLGAMALAVAAGIGALVAAFPVVGIVMKVVGSVYLVYLAVQIARAGSMDCADVARPLGLLQAAAFQAINPKAWIFALGAITTFRPADLPIVTGSLLVAATMAVVVVPSAAAWAAGGGAISRLVRTPRTRRAVSLALAVLVAGTVALVWL
jgi:threonine/homoserine/homoserine lactone efflux protein